MDRVGLYRSLNPSIIFELKLYNRELELSITPELVVLRRRLLRSLSLHISPHSGV
jgi:hypothetical protein